MERRSSLAALSRRLRRRQLNSRLRYHGTQPAGRSGIPRYSAVAGAALVGRLDRSLPLWEWASERHERERCQSRLDEQTSKKRRARRFMSALTSEESRRRCLMIPWNKRLQLWVDRRRRQGLGLASKENGSFGAANGSRSRSRMQLCHRASRCAALQAPTKSTKSNRLAPLGPHSAARPPL